MTKLWIMSFAFVASAVAQQFPLTSPAELEPVTGDVSQAGDLAWLTGPYEFTDQRKPESPTTSHGCYFSVWRKQPDGSWRVILDAGVETPGPAWSLDEPFRRASQGSLWKGPVKRDVKEETAELKNQEEELRRATASLGLEAGYRSFLAEDARMHRTKMSPIVGTSTIRSWLSDRKGTPWFQVLQAEVSRSADLGYTMGSYGAKSIDRTTDALEKGYYVRVWKRDTERGWQIVMETTLVLPAEKKQQ